MNDKRERKSLMDYLRSVPDPRSRQGRRYPLPGILAMLILAALHGEKYLRGMWLWAQAHQEKLLEPLDFWAVGRLPTLVTIWNLLAQLDVEALERAVSAWAANWGMCGALSLDGKYLRGSKREGSQALQVVTAVAQDIGIVLRQTKAEGDELEAAIALLEQLPLEGQIVSLDAGLLQRRLVETVVKKGEPTSAP